MNRKAIVHLTQSPPSRFRLSPHTRKRILFFAIVFLLALSVRFLTFNFLRAHLNDPAWFQSGSYRVFEKGVSEMLDGKGRWFWIDDPTRTDLIQYPPAYPWMVAAVYRVTGQRSPAAVQLVQAPLDLIFSLLLITGLAATAYDWSSAMAASVMVALSPLLAIVGVAPSSDAPCTWFVIAGLWLLLCAARRGSAWLALAAGFVLGIACWLRVNPLYLCLFWALPLFFFGRANVKRRALMAGAVVLGTALMIAPIVIRNYLVFPDFTPTGGTIGANLWEGLGETELGRNHGFAFGDELMDERERVRMGIPADAPWEAMWPDGIRRDRERAREALSFIRQHPIWYGGVMLRRMWGMLKIAGTPSGYYGTAGINVTSRKCLSPLWQGGLIALAVNLLGMLQSVARYVLLPLAAVGLWLAWRKESLATILFAATIFYYLVPGTIGHTEIRYVLTLHWLLPIFAGVTIATLARVTSERVRRRATSNHLT